MGMVQRIYRRGKCRKIRRFIKNMIRINQLKIPVGHSADDLKKSVLRLLHIPEEELLDLQIFRRSIDARKKPQIVYVYTIDVKLQKEEKVLKRLKNKVQTVEPISYETPAHGTEVLNHRPVIIGAGPAGLFCAYLLAKEGYRPMLLERGASVEERIQDVDAFWKTGALKPESNVQFGEGGAGTFSDGKLNTLVKDKNGRNRFVLETFVHFGAPKQILYDQKPHIGTDVLSKVIPAMREEICRLGGEVRFHSKVTDFIISENHLQGLIVNNSEKILTECAVLAIGHSARDTFQMLYEHDIPMLPKSFAVGVRIEHPQQMVQESQYGTEMADALPAASYKLTENLENGRGVYTFCMCPGGYVVNASSEPERLAVNGMSYYDRDGENANSAIIVTVTPEDFMSSDFVSNPLPDQHPLAGVAFQRELEERAYQLAQGKVPVQCFGDFCQNRSSKSLGVVMPQIRGEWKLANVRAVFPEELAASLEEGIKKMDRKIRGFAREDALLSGVESRTSSPVRICRNEQQESEISGIYPCGEGAGYAGGITSAAMDGMKTAEALIRKFAPYES